MYTPPVAPRHERAEPLPPDDRRRAIIEAVIPLFLERGMTVTTREMAEAAGIAEGTIFGVFPDKPSVVHEAVKVSMDPAPIQRAIDEIPASAPLNTQLEAAARILLERNPEAVYAWLPVSGLRAEAQQSVLSAQAQGQGVR